MPREQDTEGVDWPDASPDEVQQAFREKLKHAHPDQGGSREAYERLRDAKEAMLS